MLVAQLRQESQPASQARPRPLARAHADRGLTALEELRGGPAHDCVRVLRACRLQLLLPRSHSVILNCPQLIMSDRTVKPWNLSPKATTEIATNTANQIRFLIVDAHVTGHRNIFSAFGTQNQAFDEWMKWKETYWSDVCGNDSFFIEGVWDEDAVELQQKYEVRSRRPLRFD